MLTAAHPADKRDFLQEQVGKAMRRLARSWAYRPHSTPAMYAARQLACNILHGNVFADRTDCERFVEAAQQLGEQDALQQSHAEIEAD